MTIAAAFRCLEGLILCSDSEVEWGELKGAERKIYAFNIPTSDLNVAVAFAGSMPYARMLIEELKVALGTLLTASANDHEISSVTADALVSFHERQIFKHPERGTLSGPVVYLLIVAQHVKTKSISIFSTYETAVNTIGDDYSFVGSGWDIAAHVVRPLAHPALRMTPKKNVALLATHMLYQTKKYASGCGGNPFPSGLLVFGGFVFLSLGIVLSYETWMNASFYSSDDLNVAGDVALIVLGHVLMSSGFGCLLWCLYAFISSHTLNGGWF